MNDPPIRLCSHGRPLVRDHLHPDDPRSWECSPQCKNPSYKMEEGEEIFQGVGKPLIIWQEKKEFPKAA